MNKVILMGRLTRDPEIRYSQGVEPVAVVRYSLAVDRRFKREGEPTVDFFNCVVFGKSAEFANNYFRKGLMVTIAGRLSNNSWVDKSTGQNRVSTEIIVEEQNFAESKSSFESRMASGSQSFVSSEFSQQPNSAQQPTSPQNQYSTPNITNSQQTQSDNTGDFYTIEERIDEEDLPF